MEMPRLRNLEHYAQDFQSNCMRDLETGYSRELGEVAFDDYSFARYDRVLMGAKERGEKIYSAAYIMPSGGRSSPYPQKHRMHLKMLERMMEEKLPARIAQAESMKEAFALLRAYPTIGDFLAYQFIIDLNYSNQNAVSQFSQVFRSWEYRGKPRKSAPGFPQAFSVCASLPSRN